MGVKEAGLFLCKHFSCNSDATRQQKRWKYFKISLCSVSHTRTLTQAHTPTLTHSQTHKHTLRQAHSHTHTWTPHMHTHARKNYHRQKLSLPFSASFSIPLHRKKSNNETKIVAEKFPITNFKFASILRTKHNFEQLRTTAAFYLNDRNVNFICLPFF